MARKAYCFAKKIIDAGDMSGDLISDIVGTTNLDNIGLILEWTGTTPVGTIYVDVRNNSNGVTSTWSTLDFGTLIGVAGNTGDINLSINQTPFDELRVRYDNTSGTGALTVIAAGKTVGA